MGKALVDQDVQDTTYKVTLAVGDLIDWHDLVRTLHANVHARHCWRVLTHNESLKVLRDNAIRDIKTALARPTTLTLTPAAARTLGRELLAASDAPMGCTAGDDHCGNFAVRYNGFSGNWECATHAIDTNAADGEPDRDGPES